MRKLSLSVLCAAAIFASCTSNPKGDKAATSDQVDSVATAVGTNYNVDVAASTITWTGSKVTGSHHGTINLQSGNLSVNETGLVGGEFVVDMNSLVNEDLKGNDEYKTKLETHLKSEDFFATEKFPTAKFVITDVKHTSADKVDVSGNLTLKDVTKNISFPVSITQNTAEAVTGTADFNINRKDWGIVYEGMKDDLIADEINFKVNITAKK